MKGQCVEIASKKLHPFPFFQKNFPNSKFLVSPFLCQHFFRKWDFFFPANGWIFSPCIHVFLFFEKKNFCRNGSAVREKIPKTFVFFVLACSKKINQSINQVSWQIIENLVMFASKCWMSSLWCIMIGFDSEVANRTEFCFQCVSFLTTKTEQIWHSLASGDFYHWWSWFDCDFCYIWNVTKNVTNAFEANHEHYFWFIDFLGGHHQSY